MNGQRERISVSLPGAGLADPVWGQDKGLEEVKVAVHRRHWSYQSHGHYVLSF